MFYKHFLPTCYLIIILFYVQNIFSSINPEITEFDQIRQSFSKVDLQQVTTFFKLYNSNQYPDFLSGCFDHLNIFLDFSKQTKQPRSFMKKVLNLFDQRLHATNWINGFMFEYFLIRFLRLKEFTESEKTIQNNIIDFISNLKYQDLKNLNQEALTAQVAAIFETETDLDIQSLHFCIETFLRTSLDRLVWSPEDDVWSCVKNIASNLEKLLKANLIADEESLNSLYWVLINRFAYFLELAGQNLDDAKYKKMHQDLTLENENLWSLPEVESNIISKKDFLQQVVIEGNAVSVLFTREFISSL